MSHTTLPPDEPSGSYPRSSHGGASVAHIDKSGTLTVDVKTIVIVVLTALSGGGVIGTAGGFIGGKIPDDVRADIAAAKESAAKAERNTSEIARDLAVLKEDRPRVQKVMDDVEARLRRLEERTRLTPR